ncbi:MAG: Hint domain-containing protein [Pseudomonadota bacterium]
MAVFTLYTLEASDIIISDTTTPTPNGQALGNDDQGDASHLQDKFITLTSNDWRTVEVDDSDNNFNDSDNSQTIVNDETYNGTFFASGRRVEAEYTLTLEDPDGTQYTVIGFNINEPGVTTFTTVEGLAFIGGIGEFPPRNVPLEVVGTAEGPGGSSTPYATYATPPCLTPGTRVATPAGDVLAEDLRRGDLVDTADHGAQPIRWIGRAEARGGRRVWPVEIAAHAFGTGCPARPLRVSPQHRVAVADWRCEVFFAQSAVLVPAIHLVDGQTVRQVRPRTQVTYIHLMFDRHELIRCEGLWTESFLPGPLTLAGLDVGPRAELLDLFPHLRTEPAPLAPVLPSLKGHEGRFLRARVTHG